MGPPAETTGRSRRCRRRHRRPLRPSRRVARHRRSILNRSPRRPYRPAIGALISGHATATALPGLSAANGSPEPARPDQPAAYGRGDGQPAQRKEAGGSYIDQELRARVDGDIAVFLAAFDAALLEDTQESRAALREATDRLLRAGARTRIELERLEARMPLPPRDGGRPSEPVWRQR